MELWNKVVQEDLEMLASQAEGLEAALNLEAAAEDKRVAVSWVVRMLYPILELHFRKEEQTFFSALEQVLGKHAGALAVLKDQHEELRRALRQVAELVQAPDGLDWNIVAIAGDALLELVEDHQTETWNLLIDVLKSHLESKRLDTLAEAFQETARKAYEEGWPRPPVWKKNQGLEMLSRARLGAKD